MGWYKVMKLFKDLTLGEVQEVCREQKYCEYCPLYIKRRNGYEDCFAHGDFNFYTRPDLWYVPKEMMIDDT